jgi:hypothetical protein
MSLFRATQCPLTFFLLVLAVYVYEGNVSSLVHIKLLNGSVIFPREITHIDIWMKLNLLVTAAGTSSMIT